MPIGTLEAIQQGGLVLYACLKAFLPLPSLEVVLIPLILKNPDGWLLYAMEGAVGTAIGGWIGYQIARRAQQAEMCIRDRHGLLGRLRLPLWRRLRFCGG